MIFFFFGHYLTTNVSEIKYPLNSTVFSSSSREVLSGATNMFILDSETNSVKGIKVLRIKWFNLLVIFIYKLSTGKKLGQEHKLKTSILQVREIMMISRDRER